MAAAIIALSLLVGGLYVISKAEGFDIGSQVSDFFSSTVGGFLATTLDANGIAPYAQAAGFSGDDLATAIAVALAESSGKTNAYNPETAAGAPDGKGSYGLWQIYLHAHPEYEGVDLNDPQNNANAAYAIYSAAGGFGPWSTFKNGAYEAYLDDASGAVNA